MSRSLVAVSLVTFFVATGCDDDPSSNDTKKPSTQPSAEALKAAGSICDAEHTALLACGGDATSEEDRNRCEAENAPCWAAAIRPEAIAIVLECMQSQKCTAGESCSCSPSEDQCFSRGSEAFKDLATVRAFTERCATKLGECGRSSNSFSDDWCASSGALTDAVLSAQTECFDLACGDYTIGTCLKQRQIEATGGACADD